MVEVDTQLFYWINHHYNPVLDWVMWVASQAWCWAIVLVIVFSLTTLRREPRNWWLVLTGIGLCFLLSDRISVLCFKDVVCRLRPCHALEDVRMFRTSCGGAYGFISSHAANVFALAMFLSLRYHSAIQKASPSHRHLVSICLFAWAMLVGYSRPYLGKHYPGDVICGALVGLGIGALVWAISRWVERIIEHRHASKNESAPERSAPLNTSLK